MSSKKPSSEPPPTKELPDSWWYRVYAAVIASLVLTLLALWAFSRYFSS